METETIHHLAVAWRDQLPVLAVLVPFLMAPLVVVLGSRAAAWWLAFLGSLGALAASWLMLLRVLSGEVLVYHLGGWAPPLGIEYRVDAANAFVLFLVSAVAVVVLPYARRSLAAELPLRQHTLFYAMFLMVLSGLLGVTATADAFNVFVFLEISSLSTYVLVAQGAYRDRRALTAAYDYLMMGTIGATFFVIGLGFLYMSTGTLNMADIAQRIADQGMNRTVRAAFAFIVVGIGMKVAIYPLHLWLPNAYTHAPSAVTSFLAATATKVAVYVLLRFTFSVFGAGFGFARNTLEWMILPFALLAMFAASIIAIFQNDFKRMLAYSSIAQIGYMLLGAAMLNKAGLAGAVVHLFNHGITKAALFMGLGALALKGGGSFYRQIEGLGRTMPLTAAAMVVAGLSLIGVPGTAGFVSKWMLVQAALEKGWWPVALLIVASSLLAVVYVWKGIEAIYLKAPADPARAEAPLAMLLPIWIAAGATIWFGLNATLTMSAANLAAEGLLAGPFQMR